MGDQVKLLKKAAVRKLILLVGSAVVFVSFQNFGLLSLNDRLSARGDLLDFMVQNVCVDEHNMPIPGDPATCTKQRNLRVGEPVPYLRTDFGPNGARYQGMVSLPVKGSDGAIQVLTSKHHARNFNKYTFDFDAGRDGYDLIETNGTFSAIRTSDPGCGDQIISRDASQREDGWILFPDALNSGNGSTRHPIRIQRLNPPAACDAANNGNRLSEDSEAHTQVVWDLTPFGYTYEGGKVLQTVDSYHVANFNLSQKDNAIEKFFFTREYGFTRWEAWIPRDRCYDEKHWFCNDPNLALRGRCSDTGVTEWGGQVWVRVDCRDSTNYKQIATPFLPLTPAMGPGDIDYAGSMSYFHSLQALKDVYRNLLGRDATSAELASYERQLTAGTSLDSIRAEIGNTREALIFEARKKNPVIGYVDGVDETGFLGGWACAIAKDGPLDVHIYGSDKNSAWRFIKAVRSNAPSESGVAGACWAQGMNYRFRVDTRAAEFLPFRGRQLRVYAISPTGGENPQLIDVKIPIASVKNRAFEKENLEVVKTLYRDILGREADPAGLQFHLKSLNSGVSVDVLRKRFAYSNEASRLIRNAAVALLGRKKLSAAEARDFWAHRLLVINLEQLRLEFSASAEGKAFAASRKKKTW